MKNKDILLKKVMLLLVFALVLINLAGCLSADSSNPVSPTISRHDDGKYTLEEASQVTGLPVPAPTYLPQGYEIAFVQLEIEGIGVSAPPGAQWWNFSVTINKSETAGEESPGNVILTVNAFSLGMKIPDGVETFQIGNGRGRVSRQTGYIQLSWVDREGRGLSLTGNKELQFEELVRVAQSVTAPPVNVLETELVPEEDITVLKGESGDIIIRLQNHSNKFLDVAITQEPTDLPEGITLKILNNSFTLKPEQSIDVPVTIKVAIDAPSPTWQHRPASTAMPEEVPPPLGSITEDPYYNLRFKVSYQYPTFTEVLAQAFESLSTDMKIDAPRTLPAGMFTLEEAEQAADFPVAMLLPSYLPEGVNPPPIGYVVSTEEPHSITVYYSAFYVILSPEPGVSELPVNFPGERTTIRNKPVIIREGRIDWWIYDIHFSVVSDSVPISELKLIAESMMLVGPYSGSWLNVDIIK
jgi:hypothetical protein